MDDLRDFACPDDGSQWLVRTLVEECGVHTTGLLARRLDFTGANKM